MAGGKKMIDSLPDTSADEIVYTGSANVKISRKGGYFFL